MMLELITVEMGKLYVRIVNDGARVLAWFADPLNPLTPEPQWVDQKGQKYDF